MNAKKTNDVPQTRDFQKAMKSERPSSSKGAATNFVSRRMRGATTRETEEISTIITGEAFPLTGPKDTSD